jgi:hypothetical protein
MLKHEVQYKPEGYVALYEDNYRGSGIAFGGYARADPSELAQRNPDAVVINVKRARQVAREYHYWDMPEEDEIREAAMAGR